MPLFRSDRATSVRIQISETLKAQIAEGVYGPGASLPSTRALAAELGVSRTTVTAAYDQLIAEGYLQTRQGAKTRVASGVRTRAGAPEQHPATRSTPKLSGFGKRVLASSLPPRPAADRLLADFRYGDLSADDFPTQAWKRALSGALLRRQTRLSYDDPCGLPELRTALQAYLWRARGLRCDLDQVIVVNGSQQALDLCARIFLDQGDRIVIEDPCYLAARRAFEAIGARLVPLAVDEEGMQTSRLAGLSPARLAYVTPSHQFPHGGVMSVARRQELLAWAQQAGAHVIEDDYDGEYRFDTQPIEALQSLDRAGVVIYVGTISKILSPQLRLGYLVVPRSLSSVFAAAKSLTDRHSPRLEQAALTQLLEDGTYERHVRKARRRNGERRAALLAALSNEYGDQVTVVGAAAGLHVVAWFNQLPQECEDELVTAARKAGVGVYPIGPLYHPETVRPSVAGLVLGYACLEADAIRHGIRRLAYVFDGFKL